MMKSADSIAPLNPLHIIEIEAHTFTKNPFPPFFHQSKPPQSIISQLSSIKNTDFQSHSSKNNKSMQASS